MAYSSNPYGSGNSYSGDPYGDSAPAGPAPKKSGGGGILGALGEAGHFIADKSERAARDIKSIPSGLIEIAKAPIEDTAAGVKFIATGKGNASQAGSHSFALGKGLAKSTATAVKHPLRDPFQTATAVLPVASGALRAGEIARGVDITEPRVLKVGDTEQPLIPSRSALGRAAQKPYTKTLQKALDKNEQGHATGPVSSKVAAHAMKRVGGAAKEEARIQARMRAVPAQLLDRAAGKLSKLPAHRREEQAALELTSVQTTPEEAAAYLRGQAEKGVNVKQNQAVARLYDRVAQRGLVQLDESKPAGEKVFVNPAHGALAKTDQALARVQSRGDRILEEKQVRTGEALRSRNDAPGQIREGGYFEKPTPGKLGKETPGLKRARQRVVSLQGRIDRAKNADEVARDQGLKDGTELKGPMRFHARTPRQMAQLRGALAVAKDDLARNERAAARRIKPTGIVGGETARPGRGFVSEAISEKKLGKAEASASRGQVVGVAREPITRKTYTGRALEQGLRPKHVTASASRHFREIMRFVNTDAIRRKALETGSDVKRSERDVLVRNPDVTPEELGPQVQQALGRERPTVDTPEELATHDIAVQEGLRAAHEMFRDAMFRPGELKAKFTGDKAEAVGTPAPKGYRWVDRNSIGDLVSAPAGPRGKLARTIDNINSAVTAATVYFKIGHVGTRVLTNAATNIIQGSATPVGMKRSLELWEKLDEEQRARMLAAAGQHGFASLPHEGTSRIAKVASKGAGWWAKHADAPFRFNSLAYELRKIGYRTPQQVTKALDGLESGGQGMPAHEWAKLSAAGRRADREAISYDRLSDFEKRYITRAVWFYPWIKGSTLFTVRTAIEHPYKTGLLGQAGAHGRQVQEQTLGPTPSYEAGLFSLGGGQSPLTTDFSTFSPFATAADVAETPSVPGAVAGFFNPALGAAGQFAYGLNQYGSPSKRPLADALLALGASTPEQQIAEAFANQGNQSNRMFPKTPGATLERFLVGPAMPRRVNKAALNKAAAREKSGQR